METGRQRGRIGEMLCSRLSLGMGRGEKLREFAYVCVCAPVLLFPPEEACVFLVRDSQTRPGSFPGCSQESSEFSDTVPVAGGGGGGGCPGRSFFSVRPGSVSPRVLPPLPSPQLGCLLSTQEAPGWGWEVAGEREALCNQQSPSSPVREAHHRGSRSYLK